MVSGTSGGVAASSGSCPDPEGVGEGRDRSGEVGGFAPIQSGSGGGEGVRVSGGLAGI